MKDEEIYTTIVRYMYVMIMKEKQRIVQQT